MNRYALILPQDDFARWLRAADAYLRAFDRVQVVAASLDTMLARFSSVSVVAKAADEDLWRACPNATLVDLLAAETPDELTALLAERVRRGDRFGAWLRDDHLHKRFTLALPVDPGRLSRAGDGLLLNAAHGSVVRAPADGIISAAAGGVVELHTAFNGHDYTIRCAGLSDLQVRAGMQISRGSSLGLVDDTNVRLSVKGGAQDSIDPLPLLYVPELRLRPTASGVRLRAEADADSAPLTDLHRDDLLETLDGHGHTLLKLGRESRWIRVRTLLGAEGSAAAWLLEATAREAVPNLTGVNLDPLHPLGQPVPARLEGLGCVRFVYRAVRFPTAQAADLFYAPLIEGYRAAHLRVILALTPQTYGDGAGYVWESLTDERWNDFIPRFAESARRLARQYAGKIAAYDLWDAPAPLEIRTRLLTETIRALRAGDPNASVLVGGDPEGLRALLAAGAAPDGIALDAVGCGVPGASPRYAPRGTIDAVLAAYGAFRLPIWITSFGVADKPDDAPAAIARYAVDVVHHLRQHYRGQVAALCWSGWADGIGDGFGLVDRLDRAKPPLLSAFLDA